MSVTSIVRPAAVVAGTRKQRRHRLWIAAGACAALALTVALLVHGFGYYTLASPARALSPRHAALKPGGRIGHSLGILGGALLLLMYLYPLRKRWKWLSKKGKTKHWLDYHILMGLTAPVIVTFHSSFKFSGIAGLAYWIMLAVVVSGIVGRYLYSRIPRKLDAMEMSFDEMALLCAEMARQVRAQKVLSPEELEPLLALPPISEVQAMPVLKALVVIVGLDLRRSWLIWRLRRTAAAQVVNNAELNQALATVRKQAALSKDALFLSKMHELFHLWHIVHRPFSYSLAVLVTLHVAVVMFLGYY